MSGSTAVAKFVAYAALYAYGLTVLVDTIGTSTYTAANGTVTAGGTATTSSQSVSVYVVSNTSTTTTAALATATYGPYLAGGVTTTAQAGLANVFSLNTSTGTNGYGGVFIPAYSEVYFQSGTDATAKVTATLDFQLAPLTAVTA
jgi:hypothetical protein